MTNENTNLVENQEVNTQETLEAKDVENASTTSENEDSTDIDVDFQEDEEVEQPKVKEETKKETKTKQHSNKNKHYAEMRRQGFLEAMDTNPFTGQKIENDEDIEQYKLMKQMDKEGLDPNNTSDYLKFKKSLEQKERAKIEEQERVENENKEKANQRFQQDLGEFSQKYPNVNFVNWLNEIPNERKGMTNEQQAKYLSDKKSTINAFISSGMSLSNAYELFNNINGSLNIDTANNIAQRTLQASLASPGSQTDGNNVESTKVNYKTMTDEEFRKIRDKRLRGL